MEVDITLQQQLLEEICESLGVGIADIPEQAITVYDFAEKSGLSREHAQSLLKRQYDAGELKRAKGQNKRYYYWK